MVKKTLAGATLLAAAFAMPAYAHAVPSAASVSTAVEGTAQHVHWRGYGYGYPGQRHLYRPYAYRGWGYRPYAWGGYPGFYGGGYGWGYPAGYWGGYGWGPGFGITVAPGIGIGFGF